MRAKSCLFAVLCVLAMGLSSCKRYAEISTSVGKPTSFGTSAVPIGGVLVTGTFVSAGTGAGGGDAPWSCTTVNSTNLLANGTCTVDNVMSPANWETTWCLSPAMHRQRAIPSDDHHSSAVDSVCRAGAQSRWRRVHRKLVPRFGRERYSSNRCEPTGHFWILAYPSSIAIASFTAIPTPATRHVFECV